jgi:oligopeptide/dipeptide ABC transporter ATP-binding protein
VSLAQRDDVRNSLEVEEVTMIFRQRGAPDVLAVDHASFNVEPGGSIGLVGESGSGKTTLARCILRLIEPTSGSVRFRGVDVTALDAQRLRSFRRHMQMVFQNPYDSLNPRWPVRKVLDEPLRLHTELSEPQRRERARELLDHVRLDGSFLGRYPHEMSGGEQQRVGVARALATSPDLLVLDEPTSALDSLTRVELLGLLNRLRGELGLTYVFISHDLASVRAVSDHMAVMYLGRLVEEGPAAEVFAEPYHPYTRTLLSGVLSLDPGSRRRRLRLSEELVLALPSLSGCRLMPRCERGDERCTEAPPVMREVSPGRRVACFSEETGDEHTDHTSLPIGSVRP